MAVVVAVVLQIFQSANGILIILAYGIDILAHFLTYYN